MPEMSRRAFGSLVGGGAVTAVAGTTAAETTPAERPFKARPAASGGRSGLCRPCKTDPHRSAVACETGTRGGTAQWYGPESPVLDRRGRQYTTVRRPARGSRRGSGPRRRGRRSARR
ncbi:hypothetical protein GJU35_31585 [Streptomyces lincolnensis]|nr:hypothetical protein GJU35_31585 [Streptomyces lincolnensis]